MAVTAAAAGQHENAVRRLTGFWVNFFIQGMNTALNSATQ